MKKAWIWRSLASVVVLLVASSTYAQEPTPHPDVIIEAGEARQVLVGKEISFDTSLSQLPEGVTIEETLWDFGDGVRTTGDNVSHAFRKPGTYTVKLRVSTNQGSYEDQVPVDVFEHVMVLVADSSVSEETLAVHQQQAAREGLLVVIVRAKGAAPSVVVEEELTAQLLDVRDEVNQATILITWTSGGVGANVLSKFAQHLRQAENVDLAHIEKKAVILISDTPFAVLAPTAQSVFDQLQPSYVLLTRSSAIDLLRTPQTAEEARTNIFTSPVEHRLMGTFSARTVRTIGITNFISFGISFLVNRGVPINNIVLILMLPVIATILAFSRQVIGIKAFGIITPAMTTLSFLVMGLQYGLIVFSAMFISGTVTRMIVRRLHLLYLPRMALVLTTVSVAMLVLLGLGAAQDSTTIISFSIFPTLILTLLAEEFISLQFKSGARAAARITVWTLILSIGCYFIVNWELFRTLVLSYPEITLLTIPVNVLLGRWKGLRITEYFRFRKLINPGSTLL